MVTPSPDGPGRPALRLWPGVLIAVLQLLACFAVPRLVQGAEVMGVLGGVAGLAATLIWWLFFSRAPWSERLGALALAVAAVLATRPLMHVSIQTGMMGLMFFVYAVPQTLGLVLVAWALAALGGRLWAPHRTEDDGPDA